MRSFYKNYKWRLVFSVTASLFLILLIFNIITYSILKSATEHHLGLGARSAAVAVSLWISDNLDSYRAFLENRDVNSDYYRNMQSGFAQIKKQNNIKFIYTLNMLDNNKLEIILDSEPIGSVFYSAPGDFEEFSNECLEVFSTKKPAILTPNVTSYGVMLGSCAPILDENREVIGAVGVDIDSGTVFSILKHWFTVSIIVCLLLLGFICFLLSKVSVFLLDPLLKDKLTGAYTKRYLDTLLQKCIDSATKMDQDLSVMMLDLDHFKNVNDTYGHQFGDVVLAKTSNMIHSCLRKDDFLIRYGGEEFLVLLFNLDTKLAVNIAERIRKNIEATGIYNEKENKSIGITISIGVTSLHNGDFTGVELINNADKALYKAKETRNAVAVR